MKPATPITQFIAILLIISSCGQQQRFDAIKNYEQNKNEIDLQFEGIDFVVLDTITFMDSLEILKPIFEANLQNALKYFHHEIQSSIQTVQWINNFQKNEIEHFKKILEEEHHYQEYLIETLKVFTDECCDATYLKEPKHKLDMYQSFPDSVIGYTALVTYSALNPDFDYNKSTVQSDIYLLNFRNEVITRVDEKSLLNQSFMEFPYE